MSETDIEVFLAAGYGTKQVLEVILGTSQKVLSNYTNHEVDAPFVKFAWAKDTVAEIAA
ncbi:hypothetical protein [uncultured Ruegeria sp.]|uniref:hypothetical protein n=1 Tax=uncultured Ruegeria sp. TaxID=259304 RepID=UPI002608B5E7|nr:hypothetical protein [uncultured Ruegeria sp.]